MSDIMDTTSKTASAAGAADLIKNGYLIATKSVQDCNTKLIEFAHTNTTMAFDFSLTLGREIAFGADGAGDRACTRAIRSSVSTIQGTGGARPEGRARDHRAPQHRRE
jgi:hypothetical protein